MRQPGAMSAWKRWATCKSRRRKAKNPEAAGVGETERRSEEAEEMKHVHETHAGRRRREQKAEALFEL